MKLLAPALVLALVGSVAAQSHRVASTGDVTGTRGLAASKTV
jgi:hypothetical protein